MPSWEGEQGVSDRKEAMAGRGLIVKGDTIGSAECEEVASGDGLRGATDISESVEGGAVLAVEAGSEVESVGSGRGVGGVPREIGCQQPQEGAVGAFVRSESGVLVGAGGGAGEEGERGGRDCTIAPPPRAASLVHAPPLAPRPPGWQVSGRQGVRVLESICEESELESVESNREAMEKGMVAEVAGGGEEAGREAMEKGMVAEVAGGGEEAGMASVLAGHGGTHAPAAAKRVNEPPWVRRRRKKAPGSVASHARFLQELFRRTRRLRPGCWSRGGMRGLHWFRPPVIYGCGGGSDLAPESAFVEQRERFQRACDWYRNYTRLLQARSVGRTPTALVTFCKQGGASEGVRRAGGATHGQDLHAQPRYLDRFGPESFTQGDSTCPSGVADLRQRAGAFLTIASPPCKAYSGSLMQGVPSEGKMINETRSALNHAGGLHLTENVVGAGSEMADDRTILRGCFTGDRVDRPRLFEANFKVVVDVAISEPGLRLRQGCCLGLRRRWRRIDSFGRPVMTDCCEGNIWAVQGDKPLRCTRAECAAAMGIDGDHMDYDGLSQALPPAYTQYLFGQACMREVEREFGIPAITYDEHLANPEGTSRRMRHWLRGAGGPSPDQGVGFEERRSNPAPQVDLLCGACVSEAPAEAGGGLRPAYAPVHTDATGDLLEPPSEDTVGVAEWRELWYSWAGDYDQVHGSPAALAALGVFGHIGSMSSIAGEELRGSNSLIGAGRESVRRLAARVAQLADRERGTRVTLEVLDRADEARLRGLGFSLVRRVEGGAPAYATAHVAAQGRVARSYWAIGTEKSARVSKVDYEALGEHMDPMDRPGATGEPKSAKMARSYMPVPWEPERWDIGLPAELDAMMARAGVGIEPVEELGPTEIPFYKWASQEGLLKSIQEADRALAAGAMEYVPEGSAAEVLSTSTVHPWTIVDQGGGKWRLCHDYSVGINKVVPTTSFVLPSVWDVRTHVKPGTHFAKYDIRDGFWHAPIAPGSRKRLVVRHPGTGRLMWATRLPFGYVDSPRLFCGLTEAVVDRLRKQAAGKGIKFFVFVDDILVVGETKELTAEGMALLEAEFAARGLIWAPHKKRGPCQCIDFLGLLLANAGEHRGITLTAKRLAATLSDLDSWAAMRDGDRPVEVEPLKLAKFLGKLVFASQTVQGGRTYMQGMLAQFKGLVVDWRRGEVKQVGSSWRRLYLMAGFWRDVAWWRENLVWRSLTPFEEPCYPASSVLAGTDASGWGTGQVAWLHGAREETVLRFTAAEKRRPINWRELLGVVRICEVWGASLAGSTVLIECDNMAAVGASRKLSSKSEDMQELVRRLLRLSEKHDFRLKITHTPGVKLDRPDQTSRGDAAEEPRARLNAVAFASVEARWGPFSSFLGAEREHGAPPRAAEATGAPRLWAHPTYNTVGSALRRVQERMAGDMATTALVVLPVDPRAAWNKFLKHGTVVGGWGVGERALEQRVRGVWRPLPVARPTQLVVFPRAAGAGAHRVEMGTPRRVSMSHREALEMQPSGTTGGSLTVAGAGYSLSADGEGLVLPLVPGSYVYSLPFSPSLPDPAGRGSGRLYRVVGRAGDAGELGSRLEAREATAVLGRGTRRGGGGPLFMIDLRAPTVFPDAGELWTVDQWVASVESSSQADLITFDYKAANDDIDRREAGLASGGWTMVPGSGESTDSGYAPFVDAMEGASEGAAEALGEAAAQLDALHLSQSGLKSGPSGRVAPREQSARGGEAEGEAGSVQQVCQYAAMLCDGCQQPLAHERMRSHGLGVVCARSFDRCSRMADERAAARAAAELEEAGRPPSFWGVFSSATGASGVYLRREEAEVVTLADDAARFSVRSQACGTAAEALAFVARCTQEAAALSGEDDVEEGESGGLAFTSAGAQSTTRRLHIAEKLSSARLRMVCECIEGRCGRDRQDGTASQCLGGCGRTLHIATCAQLGRGYAALGNFRCVDCRLKEVVRSEEMVVRCSDELRTNTLKTMILELSQGAEASAAGFADFTAREEEYVLGMGCALDGVDMILPRHSMPAFKNFCTWLALDRERSRSLESTVRSAGGFMAKVGLTNITSHPSVKAHVKELMGEIGVVHEPATAATPAMLDELVGSGRIMQGERWSELLGCRDAVQAICEGVGGCRVGEVSSGGDAHGLLANNTAILEDPVILRCSNPYPVCGTVVEAWLEHSKTGYGRYLDMAGTTRTTKIECAKIMKDYWKAAGFATTTSYQAGVKVTRPDVWVLRVSFLGMAQETFDRLMSIIKKSGHICVAKYASTTIADSKLRYKASGVGSQAKKHMNVAMGPSDMPSLLAFKAELDQLGFEAAWLPAPLLLASSGGKFPKLKTTGLGVKTAADHLKACVKLAHLSANANGKMDRDLDVEAGHAPKWSSHSLRRLADTVAKRYQSQSGVTDEMIDLYFGWNEKILLKAMQTHYRGMSIRERMKSALVTGWM